MKQKRKRLSYRQRKPAIDRKKEIANRKWYQLAKELRNLLLKPNS